MSDLDDIKIPPLPVVVVKVMQYDYTDDRADASSMERIIEPDKGIASEILRVANSAYYGRSGRVAGLIDAITLLGLKTLKNLVIFLGTKQVTGSLNNPTFRKFLQEYPILSALYGREIALKLGSEDLANEAFLTGLLHRIGMSIMALNKGDHYSMMLEQSEENDFPILDLEEQAYGLNHVELAEKISSNWNLPDQIRGVIDLSQAVNSPANGNLITAITAVSSYLASSVTNIQGPVTEEQANTIGNLHLNGVMKDLHKLASEETVNKIKSHPYYEMAVS